MKAATLEVTFRKGKPLAAFSYFAMCQGQQTSAVLGYSPMPINLVQAGYSATQIDSGAAFREQAERKRDRIMLKKNDREHHFMAGPRLEPLKE